jgi:ABC-2 type transport system permease protein
MPSFMSLILTDIKLRLRSFNLLSSLFAGVIFSVLFGLGSAGAIGAVQVNFGVSSRLAMNSPVALHMMMALLCMIIFLGNAYIYAEGIDKDYETKFYEVLFSKPINTFDYLAIKALSGLIISLLFCLTIAFTLFATTYIPLINEIFLIKNNLWFYLYPIFTSMMPTMILGGGLSLYIVSISNRLQPVNICLLLVLMSMPVISTMTGDLDKRDLMAMLDPFGLKAATHNIQYWSVAEQTQQIIPLNGLFLYNRLLWAGVGCLFFFLAVRRFRVMDTGSRSKKADLTANKEVHVKPMLNPFRKQRTQVLNHWRGLASLVSFEVKLSFKNNHFLLFILTCAIIMPIVMSNADTLFGMKSWPVTSLILGNILPIMTFLMMAMAVSYAGEVTWRDRERKMIEVTSATPLSNAHFYFSKFFALGILQAILYAFFIFLCIGFQVLKGYTQIDLLLYVKYIYFYQYIPLLLFNCFIFLVQIYSPNKNAGSVIGFGIWWVISQFPTLDLDHLLYRLGYIPIGPYTDLNGFGGTLYHFLILLAYWGCFYFILGLVSIRTWPRGVALAFGHRLKSLPQAITGPDRLLIISSLSLMVIIGSFVYYNVNILNHYTTPKTTLASKTSYEKKFKSYQYKAYPALVELNLDVNFNPQDRRIQTKSHLVYSNLNTEEIEVFLIYLNKRLEISEFEWSRDFILEEIDELTRVAKIRFTTPLQPGEQVELNITSSSEYSGFQNSGIFTSLTTKHSYFGIETVIPNLGYSSILEIAEEGTRAKQGLSREVELADQDNLKARYKTYIPGISSWAMAKVNVRLPVGLNLFFPGEQTHYQEKEGHQYFEFDFSHKAIPFLVFIVGEYESLEDKWEGIDLGIYYHQSHHWNVDRMMEGMKHSLEYFTKAFSPYQFPSLQLVEIPRYGKFAQALPGLIGFSEGIGFLTRVDEDDPDAIDFPYYIVAHEVAHQWWAHQVIGAEVKGATMLSESLAQYSAYMVMQERYGRNSMRKFLRYELHQYLAQRSRTARREFPLLHTDNSPFIHYQKGGLIFYSLQYFLGEEWVNEVLREFIDLYAFQGPPFPTSVELYQLLVKKADPQYQQMLKDYFEKITLYDIATESIVVSEEADDSYQVEISGSIKKFYADEWGETSEAALSDFIPVILFNKDGEIIYDQAHFLEQNEVKINLVLDEKPSSGGLDSLNMLVNLSPKRSYFEIEEPGPRNDKGE